MSYAQPFQMGSAPPGILMDAQFVSQDGAIEIPGAPPSAAVGYLPPAPPSLGVAQTNGQGYNAPSVSAPGSAIPMMPNSTGPGFVPMANTQNQGQTAKFFAYGPTDDGSGGPNMRPIMLEVPDQKPTPEKKDGSLTKEDVQKLIEEASNKKEAKEDVDWFGLPENIYGAAVWMALANPPPEDLTKPRPANMEQYGCCQNPCPDGIFKAVDNGVRFVERYFYIFSIFGFAFVSLGLQGGFTGYLYFRFSTQNQDMQHGICYTPGWLQLFSIGYFLTVQAGQVPQAIQNLVLLGSAIYFKNSGQTDSSRKFVKETKNRWEITAKQIFASILCIGELAFISILSFVGVEYILWSGYSNVRREGWGSDTAGVEEIVMATLALQFLMEIDETVFKYMLPKAIQNRVLGVRFRTQWWCPAEMAVENIGQPGAHFLQGRIVGDVPLHEVRDLCKTRRWLEALPIITITYPVLIIFASVGAVMSLRGLQNCGLLEVPVDPQFDSLTNPEDPESFTWENGFVITNQRIADKYFSFGEVWVLLGIIYSIVAFFLFVSVIRVTSHFRASSMPNEDELLEVSKYMWYTEDYQQTVAQFTQEINKKYGEDNQGRVQVGKEEHETIRLDLIRQFLRKSAVYLQKKLIDDTSNFNIRTSI